MKASTLRPKPLKPEKYLYLQENGIDMNTGMVDYKMLSVRCVDLLLYRKAFRVKIRALIKADNIALLQYYLKTFYTFAHFVRFVYGFHSCTSMVEPWQEELATFLQTKFDADTLASFEMGSWIEYEDSEVYSKYFKDQYTLYALDKEVNDLHCIQDGKPFINLKDRSHFTVGFDT